MSIAERLRTMSPGERAKLLRRLRNTRPQKAAAIPRASRSAGRFPLSDTQRQMWTLHQLEPDSPRYNLGFSCFIDSRISDALVERIQGALDVLMIRHETLRTTFARDDEGLFQIVHPPEPVHLPVRDVDVSLDAPEILARQREEATQTFSLSEGPLFRASLWRSSQGTTRLQFVAHHIVLDAWSIGLLSGELSALLAAGPDAPLPRPSLQYVDYAVWNRGRPQEARQPHLDYWVGRLQGLPELLELPTDRPRPAHRSGNGVRLPVSLSPELVGAMGRLSQEAGTTVNVTLLSAFQALLSRLSGSADVAVGVPVAGRERPELSKILGHFANTVVHRAQLDEAESFSSLLERTRVHMLEALEHQTAPLPRIIEALQVQRTPAWSPLFQVLFNVQHLDPSTPYPDGWVLEPLTDTGTAKFDLSLVLKKQGDALVGHLEYATELFDEATIARWWGHLETLLQAATQAPETPLAELPLLSEAERRALVSQIANEPPAVLDAAVPGTLHGLIAHRAVEAPEAVAVRVPPLDGEPGVTLSYGDLDARADQLAQALLARGLQPETLVGVFLERSADLIVAVLAILKAGCAYLPIDASTRGRRLSFLLTDAQAPLVLTSAALRGELPAGAPPALCLDRPPEDGGVPAVRGRLPLPAVSPDQLAYCIYTSGSTGNPKGVLVTHRNVVRLLRSSAAQYQFRFDDVWTLFHSPAFDFSVWEIFGPLVTGGRLVVLPYWLTRRFDAFYETLESEGVTVLNQTPSAFRQLVRTSEGRPAPSALRVVIFGGEALDVGSVRTWRARHGAAVRLVNMYGITETTVHVTFCELDDETLATGRSAIGRPLADLSVHVLDDRMQPVPIGVAGELCVGGAGVARGYLNRPERTASVFVPNPYGEGMLYRSGDLGRRLADGTLEHLGRKDRQVKVRGFRIEPGEVEAALSEHADVDSCVVAAVEQGGEKVLAAYMVSKGAPPSGSELRTFLSYRLPDHLIPSVFMPLARIPLTGNGKVDLKALPKPGRSAASADDFVAPRDALEEAVTALWRELLEIERIGVMDNFFDIGGESIKVALMVERLQKALGEVVHPVMIFSAQTVAEIAAFLRERYPHGVAAWLGEDGPAAEDAASGEAAIQVSRYHLFRELVPVPPPAPALEKKNPPVVFVLSPPRSGSTLTRVMIGGHPDVFSPPELMLLQFATLAQRRKRYSGARRFWLEGLQRAVMEMEGISQEEAAALLTRFEEEGMDVPELYAWIQERLGGRMLVDKSPGYSQHVDNMRRAEAMFDGAMYIHLQRHPLACIRSFEKARLDEVSNLDSHDFTRRELAEFNWLAGHENILEFLADVPAARQTTLQFEQLVQDPEGEMRRISRFLGVDFHPGMLEPYQGSTRMTDGIHKGTRMLGDVRFHEHKGIDASVAEQWREDATSTPVCARTVAVAGQLGYDLAPPARSLVPLQLGTRRPLALVHPVGGQVLCYMPLVRALGEEAVLGFQSHGLDGSAPLLASIPEMADAYLAELRAAQPSGPYRLAGWSMGGLVAYEMAQRLEAAGEVVASLHLIDTRTPSALRAQGSWQAEFVGPVGANAEAHFALDLLASRQNPAAIFQTLRALSSLEERVRWLMDVARWSGPLRNLSDEAFQNLARVFEANRLAVANYEPAPYSGPMTLFVATKAQGHDPTAGWAELAGALETVPLDGDHYSILQPPLVQQIAARLRETR